MHQGSKFFSSDHDPDDVLLGHKAEVAAVARIQDVVAAEEIPVAFEGVFFQNFAIKRDLSLTVNCRHKSGFIFDQLPVPKKISFSNCDLISFPRNVNGAETLYVLSIHRIITPFNLHK